MLTRLLAACACVIALGACVQSEQEGVVDFPRSTLPGQIQRSGELRIAIEEVWGPFSDGPNSFVGQVGRYLADELGVEVRWVPTTSDVMLAGILEGAFDLAFPLSPLTEETARRNTMTDPYWIAHQRVLAAPRSGIESADDLAGKRVCAATSEEVDVSVETLAPESDVIESPLTGSLCGGSLVRGEVDAVVGSDAYLASVATEVSGAKIVGDELSTYGYAPLVPDSEDDTAPPSQDLVDFIDDKLAEAKSEGLWDEWFEEEFGAVAGLDGPQPPTLTLEEAATLFPIDRPG